MAAAPARRAAHHVDLRHARPGRGARGRRPDRAHEQGQDRADRHARRRSTSGRPRPSPTASSVRSTGSPGESRAPICALGRMRCRWPTPVPRTARTWSHSPARTSSTSSSTATPGRASRVKVNRVLLSGATARVELTGKIGIQRSRRAAAFRGRADAPAALRPRPAARSACALDLGAAEGVPGRARGMIQQPAQWRVSPLP